MAPSCELPCDGDGVCMVCKKLPPETELVKCRTCATPWHVLCLSSPLETLASALGWHCPDCSHLAPSSTDEHLAAVPTGGLIASIRAIEADRSLTEQEKARRRQDLLSKGPERLPEDEEGEDERKGRKPKGKVNEEALDLNCIICMQLLDRPVSTPCGHNFCLKCFQKWVGQGKRTCAKCRASIPSSMVSQPRINSALVVAIRMTKTAKSGSSGSLTCVYHFIRNENRPDKAFTTERAKKAGKANACSGQIFITVPPDHFGPILAEHDPKRNKGVLVGELWEDRMECRQWGAHLPHVAGIAGQSDYGAQSVALSGGYEDDEDHGEWFLYTGSGGRDLSGNKRTNKDQAFDQKFEKLNQALRVSCKKGYPVRVVRSHKEKRSSYAPETGVRYDGIYRIEKCWRKVGIQGFKVCRYLFVRCDNEPAPWTSDEHGDRPRPLPDIKELKRASDITERKESPAWGYDKEHGWKWTKPSPLSRKSVNDGNSERKRGRKKGSQSTSVPKELRCLICWKVMTYPLTTPCAHNFCKPCLLGAYADKSFVRERTNKGGRTLRAQKIVKKCPTCQNDISEFVHNPQVNRELMDLIESLQQKSKEEDNVQESNEERSEILQKSGKEGNGGVADNDLKNYVTDSMDEELSEDRSDAVESKRLDRKESDDTEDKKLESMDGSPENNAVNSKIKEGDESDRQTPKLSKTSAGASRTRRQTFAGKRACKKARKSEGVGDELEEKWLKREDADEDQKMQDTVGSSMVNYVNTEMGTREKNNIKVQGPTATSKQKTISIARKSNKPKRLNEDSDDSPSSPLHAQPDDDAITDDDDDFQ